VLACDTASVTEDAGRQDGYTEGTRWGDGGGEGAEAVGEGVSVVGLNTEFSLCLNYRPVCIDFWLTAAEALRRATVAHHLARHDGEI